MQKNEMDEKVIQMRNLPFQVDGQVMVYTMPQEVDHHVAQKLCAELDQLISSYQIKELVLDFEKTGFMDSSGIGIMIGRHKMMQFYGGSVAVMNMGARVEYVEHPFQRPYARRAELHRRGKSRHCRRKAGGRKPHRHQPCLHRKNELGDHPGNALSGRHCRFPPPEIQSIPANRTAPPSYARPDGLAAFGVQRSA